MSETSGEMVCDELVELVTSYVEGTLSDSDGARLEQHLTECSWCEDYVAQHREIISSLRTLGAGSPPAGTDDPAFTELLDILRRRRGERRT